jgi:hypothetical protein
VDALFLPGLVAVRLTGVDTPLRAAEKERAADTRDPTLPITCWETTVSPASNCP